MDFLSSLIAYASLHGSFTESEVKVIHSNYCQNLYFQPGAQEKMETYGCEIYEIDAEITRVKSGRY